MVASVVAMKTISQVESREGLKKFCPMRIVRILWSSFMARERQIP